MDRTIKDAYTSILMGKPNYMQYDHDQSEEDAIIEAMADAAALAMRPHGCICPPGSEKTCQGIGCPRRVRSFQTEVI